MNNRDYALLVGFDHYQSLSPLAGPIRDATEFKLWLTSPEGGAIPDENCFFIPSQPTFEPGQDHIDDNIDQLLDRINSLKSRRLYIFFAGHGFGLKYDNCGLLLPKWSTQGRNAAFSSKDYYDYFVESNLFEEVFLFLDCCRDRKNAITPRAPRNGWAIPRGEQCQGSIFFASEFTTSAYENPSGEESLVRGNFSVALMKGLKGGAVNDEGQVTVRNLANFTKYYTEHLAVNTDGKQKVVVNHINDSDDIVLYTFPNGRPLSQLRIKFKDEGSYQIKAPDLTILREGSAAQDEEWQITGLKTGNYLITTTNSERKKSIMIDNSQQIFTDEF